MASRNACAAASNVIDMASSYRLRPARRAS
jgi:hypothetical protein